MVAFVTCFGVFSSQPDFGKTGIEGRFFPSVSNDQEHAGGGLRPCGGTRPCIEQFSMILSRIRSGEGSLTVNLPISPHQVLTYQFNRLFGCKAKQ
jgi:hypothetical protein